MAPEFRSRYEACVEVCGNLDNPGLAQDIPRQVDYSQAGTTLDQARIEAALDTMDLDGKNILHVGVGNSRLAKRFASRAHLIDGLTVSQEERALAESLEIGNYRVYPISKYSRQLMLTLKHTYDFIVDNNLTGFACCKFHFYVMLDTYIWALKPGGQVLTDERGLGWAFGDPRWGLGYEDLVALEAKFPVKASKLTDTVFALDRLR